MLQLAVKSTLNGRDAPSLLTFRRLLKTLLFEQSYDVLQHLQRFCVNFCKVPLQHFVKRHYNQFIFSNNNNNKISSSDEMSSSIWHYDDDSAGVLTATFDEPGCKNSTTS